MPTITQLPALVQASVVPGTDVLAIVNGGATKKVTAQALVNSAAAALAPQGGTLALTGAMTVSSTLGVTGQASFGAGTAAAPSVKVGAEQNGLYSSTANRLDFVTNGVRQGQVSYVALAVNFLSFFGGATGTGPTMYADGSDAAVNYNHSLKGAGSHVFYTGSTSAVQAVVAHTASTNRWLTLTGSNGNAPTLGTSAGDLLLAPATGVVAFGTLTASADAPVNGYITIKTAAGATIKLATIA